MVQRRLTNPGGRRSVQMGGYGASFDQDGGLYVTDAEVEDLLAGYTGDGAGDAYTVELTDDAYPACPTPYSRAGRDYRADRYGRWC
ncbi:hypothetical protein ACFQHO_44875 [Actinomadura yumaensis]